MAQKSTSASGVVFSAIKVIAAPAEAVGKSQK
jgi:hypothetical protein